MSGAARRDLAGADLGEQFEKLFREHHRFVYRTAYGVTGRAQDAEDVLQTVFLQLLRYDRSPVVMGNPAGYLYRAAVNVSLNVVRARKREELVRDVEELLAPECNADQESTGDLQRHLLKAIHQLRPRAVEILVLHYVHGYTDAQVARLLGASRGTIAVTLYRARVRLKKLMLQAISGEQR